MTHTITKSLTANDSIRTLGKTLDMIRNKYRSNFTGGERVDLERAAEMIAKVTKSADARPSVVQEIGDL